MKTKQTVIALLLALAPLTLISASESGAPNDKTLSPYFQVKGGESSVDAMPLKSTEVNVTIAGVIADVCVTQTYSNASGIPLEATYVFPGSTRAAVYGMQMTIGDRVLKAKVQPREEARQTYEQAKTEGKSASLLEQQRPNVFQMNVANIMPGDTVKVELRYSELLVPEAGEYEFVYPTVVGPRYSNQPEASAPETDKWISNPYLMKGEKSPSTFNISVDLVAGMPLQGLRCETHPVKPEFRDASHAVLKLEAADVPANDRDFILKYRLAESKIESGLLLTKGEKENFFLLTVQPPKRTAATVLPPRDYVFVLDVSGSMIGFPLDCAKGLIRQLLGTLKSDDTFNVLLFSGGSRLLSPRSLPASRENLTRAIQVIDQRERWRWHGIASGLEAGARVAERARSGPQHRGSDRWLCRLRNAGVRSHPAKSSPRQSVRLRHRIEREPFSHRGHGAGGAGRAVLRHAAGSGRKGGATSSVNTFPRRC